MLDHGPIARSNLARLTGISASSVSGLTGELLDRGLVREVPELAGRPGVGRPHVPVDLDADGLVVFGVHVAVPQTTVTAVDPRGRVLASRVLSHHQPEPGEVVTRVAAELDALRIDHSARRLLGVGVAIGGWVDADAGVVVDHPILGWRDVALRAELAAATGLPTYLENHGRALLRAEQLVGRYVDAARKSVVHLFIGNVVDAAFSIRGRVHQGQRSASGTVAHLLVDVDPTANPPCACGRRGCLQAAVSERNLIRRAVRLGIDVNRVGDLADLATAGDERVIALFVERARLVGHAVASLLDLLNPEVLVVMETGVRRLPVAREALLAEVAARSETVSDPESIVVASSFSNPLAMAGGAVVLDRLYADPLADIGATPAGAIQSP